MTTESPSRIFITGASGCIGHYVIDHWKERPEFQLHLLVRDVAKLKFSPDDYPNLTVHIGDMDTINAHQAIIHECDYLVHIATNWDNSPTAVRINVDRTLEMLSYLNPERLKRIIYFSTASILGADSQPTPAAEQFGTGYVRSKYLAWQSLQAHALAEKIFTLFPTLVFGGDKCHPWSHISSGIRDQHPRLRWLRWIYAASGFHFMHARDIAMMVDICLVHPDLKKHNFPIGFAPISGKQAIASLCAAFRIPVWFQIPIPTRFIFWLAKKMRIQIHSWDEYCIKNPFFIYDVVNPTSFARPAAFPTLPQILSDIVSQG